MHVPANDLITVLHTLGCTIDCLNQDFYVDGLAHTEDARSHALCWYRDVHAPPPTTGIVVSRHPGEAAPSIAAWVTHANPRMVLRHVIHKFFPPRGVQVTRGVDTQLHHSAVIGAAGQGYDWDGAWQAFPHAGHVRLGDYVHVGPQATIMRGSVGDTVIGNDTKIGNHVNIGHDTRIGDHVLIVAGASIAGWVRVGDHAKIWQGALIRNGVRIGKHAEVGMGAVVVCDVPAHEVWAGNPAKRIR